MADLPRYHPDLEAALVGFAPDPGAWDDVVGSRESFRQLTARDVTHPQVRTEDLLIPGGDGQPLPVRRYTSAEPSGVGAVWFHGGGFVFGDLDGEQLTCLRVCARTGATVLSVDYRLAPEHACPAAVEDGYAALRWADDHLGVDRLAVGGHSAGGGLAAAVALMARDRGGPALAFQYLGYPVLDDRPTASARTCSDGRVFDSYARGRMWELYLGGLPATSYAAPARAEELTGLPAAHLFVVEHDPLRDEALDYARRLADAGVAVSHQLVPDAFHGFEGSAPTSEPAVRAVETWLQALADGLDVPLRDPA